MSTIDYEKQAQDFCDKHGITFSVVLIGDDCPMFCTDREHGRDMDKVNVFPRKVHIHGKHYRATFTREGAKPLVVDFWNSYADEEENAFACGKVANPENCYFDKYRAGKYPARPRLKKRHVPTSYDVLACITKQDLGTFAQFCSDYGYDEDSRRAERTWDAVREEWEHVRAFFHADEFDELNEIA